MTKQQCEFTGNRCVKDTCDNCGIYAINYLTRNITEATEKVGNEFCKIADKIANATEYSAKMEETCKQCNKNFEIHKEVNPVIHGEWIKHENPKGVFCRECSVCHVWLEWDMPRNSFCPNCGSDMRGKT